MRKHYAKEELSDALRTIDSLRGKLTKAVKKLRKGSAQETLAKRRLKALRIAAELLKAARKR